MTKQTMTLREIDAAVAERITKVPPESWSAILEKRGRVVISVGGWPTREEAAEYCGHGYGLVNRLRPMPRVPTYSTDIAAAWTIVEHCKIDTVMRRAGGWIGCGEDGRIDADGFAATAPLAICLTALKAHGLDVAIAGNEDAAVL